MGLLDQFSSWLGLSRQGVAVSVLVLGLDNSGKTSLLQALRPAEPGVALPPPLPTVGQQNSQFQSSGVTFNAWDVSGAERRRALWERHYRDADAVIFVVDCTDSLRLVVAREELHLMLSHPDVCGRRLPLLVFANKSDAPHAMSAAHIAAALSLERVLDKTWHICSSNALSGDGVREGITWLARQLRDQRRSRD